MTSDRRSRRANALLERGGATPLCPPRRDAAKESGDMSPHSKADSDARRWFGKLPANWRERPLKFAVHLRNEETDPAEELPYAGLDSIEAATGRLVPLWEAQGAHAPPGGKRFRKGQVLFSKLRPYLATASPTPGSAKKPPTRKTAASARSATRSTSTGASIDTFCREISKQSTVNLKPLKKDPKPFQQGDA